MDANSDRLIIALAFLLACTLRRVRCIARGDNYIDDVIRALGVERVAKEQGPATVPVRASIGMAVHPAEADLVATLIEMADARMYAAKRQRPHGALRAA